MKFTYLDLLACDFSPAWLTTFSIGPDKAFNQLWNFASTH